MDIITHVVAGALAGGCAALMIRGARARLAGALSWGALGGFLPDIDVATRVPGFDETFGRLLGLPPGGVIYGGSEWYSHHHFTHSLVACLVFGLLLASALGLERLIWGATDDGRRVVRIWLAPLCMSAGFLMHLAGDLVTPASVWGGIQLLWPLDTMFGGWGWAWWFNNYDLFLVQVLGLLMLGLVSLVPRPQPITARVLPAAVLALVIGACVLLLQLRQHDYAYSGNATNYQALEAASLDEQHRLLPPGLLAAMLEIDRMVPFPF